MAIKFVPNSDRDDFDSDSGVTGRSVQHVENSEQLIEGVLQRPIENLRIRTEALRAFSDRTREMLGTERGMVMFVDSPSNVKEIQFDGRWDSVTTLKGTDSSGQLHLIDTVAGELVIRPADAPYASKMALYEDVASGFTITSKKYVYQGSHNIQFQILDGGTGSPTTVAVEGGGASYTGSAVGAVSDTLTTEAPFVIGRRVTVTADCSVTTTTTTQDVINEVAADAVASGMVGVTTTNAATLMNGLTVPLSDLANGKDAVEHRIAAAELDTFFANSSNNRLIVGDCVAINYPTPFDRLKQVTDVAGATTVTASMLVNTRMATDWGEASIPIFYVHEAVSGIFPFPPGTTASAVLPVRLDRASMGADEIIAEVNTNATTTFDGDNVAPATLASLGVSMMGGTVNNASMPKAASYDDLGIANGIATLDANIIVDYSQLQNEAVAKLVARSAYDVSIADMKTGQELIRPLSPFAATPAFDDAIIQFNPQQYDTLVCRLYIGDTCPVGESAKINIQFVWEPIPGAGISSIYSGSVLINKNTWVSGAPTTTANFTYSDSVYVTVSPGVSSYAGFQIVDYVYSLGAGHALFDTDVSGLPGLAPVVGFFFVDTPTANSLTGVMVAHHAEIWASNSAGTFKV
jgi:hypothetical protein